MWFYAGIQGLNSAHKQWIIGWFKMNIIYLSILLEKQIRPTYLEEFLKWEQIKFI